MSADTTRSTRRGVVGWPRGERHTTESRLLMGAAKLGIDRHEYAARIAAGLKWCSGHGAWEPRSVFGPHKRRVDGLNSACLESSRAAARDWQRKHREGAP